MWERRVLEIYELIGDESTARFTRSIIEKYSKIRVFLYFYYKQKPVICNHKKSILEYIR